LVSNFPIGLGIPLRYSFLCDRDETRDNNLYPLLRPYHFQTTKYVKVRSFTYHPNAVLNGYECHEKIVFQNTWQMLLLPHSEIGNNYRSIKSMTQCIASMSIGISLLVGFYFAGSLVYYLFMFNTIIGRIQSSKTIVLSKIQPGKKSVMRFAKKYPFGSLFVALGLLVILIGANSFLNRPPKEVAEAEPTAKKVAVYRIGEAPTIEVQAQVEKSGVITITALTSGVVRNLNVEAGSYVTRGKMLVSLSSNYQGGNAASLQASIAAENLKYINETYDSQKDIIAKQKDMTNKSDSNNDEFRSITDKSLSETQSLISLNDSILSTLQDKLTAYEAANDATNILATKQSMTQYLSSNNSLKNALRNNEYSSAGNKPPAEISDLNRDIMIKQLDIQEKTIDLNREIYRLQYQVARVQEAAMYPSAPFNSTVQRVFVKVGEAVNPGTPLVQLSQTIEEDPIVAIAYVPREIAQSTTYSQPSILTIGNFTYDTYPSYITQDAIKGQLYGIYFPIPDNYNQYVTEDGYISVTIPVGYANTSASIPFIPIDSVYQTQDSASIFVVENEKAVSRTVTLGPVLGRYVEVTSGLAAGDIIILDRTVVDGDAIEIE